jgi:RND family efflux transporter MFP subunit
VDEGALVQMNQPIVSILENNPLVAVVFVIERDYPKMAIGQQALITTDAYPGRMFTGRIRRIAPLMKETSRQARVEIEVPNPDHRLKPGMFVRAQVEFATHPNATLVPFSALVRRAGREGIFLVATPGAASPSGRKGATRQARFVPVTTGIVNGETVEVVEPEVSGLVVTLGNHLLENGSGVIVPQQQTAGGGQEADSPGPRGGADATPPGAAR